MISLFGVISFSLMPSDAARAVRYWAKLAEAFCNQDMNPRPLVDRNLENADFRLITPICKPVPLF